MRVVVVGSRGSGKTSLIRRLKGETSSIFTVTRALDVSSAGAAVCGRFVMIIVLALVTCASFVECHGREIPEYIIWI